MKKPNIIIGKKQIILACLTMMLGIAVYVNYVLSDNEPLVGENLSVQSPDDMANADYGDSKFVNNEPSDSQDSESVGAVSADDYFAQARIDKTTGRDNAIQTLQAVIGGGDITEDEMVAKALEAVELSNFTENESKMESLIKAQGFEDCVVYLEKDSAKVVVKTEGLEAGQAAAIKDIILSISSVPAENIRIFEVR
ncbi:MAG TPA: stage III sporulation protein AH [Ruminococcus sp.]|nr:stage III sporulation protein AH [Ruminococcus sp.]HBN11109.1 stage III sporulation protein AH [Ruminococcus sp.]HCR74698.1 stage III sporulation protein AH [Ruminococcus sp.]